MARCSRAAGWAAAAVCLLLLGVPAAFADIQTETLDHDDRSIILIARPFGFESNGVIDVKVSKWKVYLEEGITQYDRRKLGFFITTAEAETQLQQDLETGGCVLESKNVELLFTFNDMDVEKKDDGTFEYPGRIPPDQGGEYSLFFANCESHVDVSAHIHVELYNEAWTGSRDYLSAGEAPLPLVYLVMGVFYALAAAIWIAVLYNNRPTTLRIHWLMLALVVVKCVSTGCEAGMFHMKRLTGTPDGWNIAFYIFSFVRGVLLFAVIVLIGTGWSFLKPFLSDKEKRVIMIVVPLQVLANSADIILLENGPAVKGWFTWRDIFHLLDIICCCAILFPIVWSIKHLREAANTDGKAARNLQKLTLFRQFYVMVVSYIYFTRIVVYLLKSTTPYQYVWLSDCAGELATLAFYCFTGFKFRPVSQNPYFHLEMDELDESEQELVRREQMENAVQDAVGKDSA